MESSVTSSFTINRLRNENKQLRSLIRDIEFDLDEERSIRKKLEQKLDKLTYGTEKKTMSNKKVKEVLDRIFDEENSSDIMTFGKCCRGRDNDQELVELRANIQLRESQFSNLKAEIQRALDAMSEERNILYEKIEFLEKRNAKASASTGVAGDNYMKERTFALSERTKHLAQIESLRCIVSSILSFSSTSPIEGQQIEQPQITFDLRTNKKLNDAFDELLTSESEYINDLNVINDVFREPMENLDKDVISKSGKSRIFNTLMSIRDQHIQLFDFLKKSIADKSKIGLGQYFFNIYDLISRYESYSQYFETALTIIHETLKIKLFSKFLITAEANPRCKGRTFMSFLLIPLQRILEYIKFLDVICLNLPQGHPELAILDQTRILLLQNIPILEENKRNAEAYIKTIELKFKISNLPQGFVVPKRRYVCDETLSIVTSDKKISVRRFFLFSDIIVETKLSSSSSKPFRMMMPMFLNDAQIEDVPDGTYTNAFILENPSGCK